MKFSTLAVISFLLAAALVGLPTPALAAAPEALEHLQRAKEYRNNGELQAAIIEFKNVLQRDPNSSEARLLLGEAYLDLRQGADAEHQFRRARDLGLPATATVVRLGEALLLQGKLSELLDELQPAGLPPADAAEVHALHGEAHLGLQETEEAAAAFDSALAINPNVTRARLGQARLALAAGEPDQARAHIEAALAAAPDDAAAWGLLGDLERQRGRQREAEAAYGEALERQPRLVSARLQRGLARIDLRDLNGAEEDLAALRRQGATHPGVQYAAGLLHFRQAQFDPAKTAFEQVLRVAPDDLPSTFYLGLAQYELGNLQQAENYLRRVVDALPQSADARRYLGMARLRLGDFDGAEAALMPLVEGQPDDVFALQALAGALQGQGKLEAANVYRQRAVDLRPDAAHDRLALAVSQLSLGKRASAFAELQRAAQLDPQLAQADMLLIGAHLQAEEFDQAISAAEQWRAKQPDIPDPLILSGIAYFGKGEPGRARAAFEQALEIDPGNPSAFINLAALALQDGDPAAARDYYEQALAQHPGHSTTLLRLASLEAQQDPKKARAHLEEAIAKNPEDLQPRVALGRFQLEADEPLKALVTVRDAPQRLAKHPELLAIQGEAQLATGEPAAAVSTLQKAIAAQPDVARPHYLLGTAFAAQKNLPAAKRELFAGMAIDPHDVLASWLMTQLSSLQPSLEAKSAWVTELKGQYPEHNQVLDLEAQLALLQGAPEKAVAIYRGLHDRNPEERVWTLTFANAQWQAGNHEASIAILTDWLEGHTDDAQVQFRLANSYLKLNRNIEAKSALARVVELQPDNIVALNNLALLLRDEDPARALRHAERAYELNQDPRIADTLGVILLHQGETQRAVEVLKEASVRSPTQPTINYHYAKALAQSGKKEQARAVLKRVTRGDFPERAEADALLSQLGG